MEEITTGDSFSDITSTVTTSQNLQGFPPLLKNAIMYSRKPGQSAVSAAV